MTVRTVIVLFCLTTAALLLAPLLKKEEVPARAVTHTEKKMSQLTDSLIESRAARFADGTVNANSFVLLGNSLTELFDQRLLGKNNIVNHGISGDVTAGVLSRLRKSISGKPAKLFLEIGINDLMRGEQVNVVYGHIVQILDSIAAQSPQTKVYLLSLTPNCLENGEALTRQVNELNKLLMTSCAEKNIRWIDMFTALGENGKLKESYSSDGLHFSEAGYSVWAKTLQPFINE